MNRRTLWILLGLAVAFLAGRAFTPSGEPLLGASPAFADGILHVQEGALFVSTDGGSAYLWVFRNRRVELVGATTIVEGAEAQATFVWSPSVERRE